jgi:murein DD-endopeptidase MepM/ murein hydrolase activator NlpD
MQGLQGESVGTCVVKRVARGRTLALIAATAVFLAGAPAQAIAPPPRTADHPVTVPARRSSPGIPDQMPVATLQPRGSVRTGLPLPFLTRPYWNMHYVTSIFDHCNPDYTRDGKICQFDGTVALRTNGVDPAFPTGYAITPGGRDYLYYDGHNGWDMALTYEPLIAAAAGTVALAGTDPFNPGFGQTVTIDHSNGITTRYAHMSQISVVPGQVVARGQAIGISGNTGVSSGPHLHFGAYLTSTWTAIDPWGWTAAEPDPWPYNLGNLWLTGNPQNPVPWEPTAVSAAAQDTGVSVKWTAPIFDGGSPITEYTVVGAPGGATVRTGAEARSALITGLMTGTTYTFTVTAGNAIGTGARSAPSNPVTVGTVWTTASTQQYRLANSDGSTWTDIDTAGLGLVIVPALDSLAILTANADVWTDTPGYNQDLAIAVSPADVGTYPANVVAWKEGGGGASAFSPTAALVHTVFPMTAGTRYTVTLQWKANRPAGGASIFAGAGPVAGKFSPTRLTAQLLPAAGSNLWTAVSAQQYQLPNSDGGSWVDLDSSRLALMFTPTVSGVAVVSGNADLWTGVAGPNQDLGLWVNPLDASVYPAGILAWKESGGVAPGSPNASYVQGVFAVTAGTAYTVKLRWKSNRAVGAPGIFAGAGPIRGTFSPTRLTVEVLPVTAVYTAMSTRQYQLRGSDGRSWVDIDPAGLSVVFTPTANCLVTLSANADLWTTSAGVNQDLAITATPADVNTYPANVLAWKESGGLGTFAPNAVFVHTVFPVTAGTAYRVRLQWKSNRAAAGSLVVGAGPVSFQFSPTRLTVQMSSCS